VPHVTMVTGLLADKPTLSLWTVQVANSTIFKNCQFVYLKF